MSSPADASPNDPGISPLSHRSAPGSEPAALLDAHRIDLDVNEAVAALSRAVEEEASDTGEPDTPARRAMLARRRARLRELQSVVGVRLNAERAIRAAERDARLF